VFAELLPWLLDQLHDWEAAAAAGAPTSPPLQPESHFRLFTTDVSLRAACAQPAPALRPGRLRSGCGAAQAREGGG
jgi:hypothetical protein